MLHLFYCTLVVFIVLTAKAAAECNDDKSNDQWLEYKQKYNKHYATKEEETHREKIFRERLQVINKHNQLYTDGTKSYKMSVNKYSDLKVEEFKSKFKRNVRSLSRKKIRRERIQKKEASRRSGSLPSKFDLREVLGTKMSPPRDQGICGSCWAISPVVATEIITALKLNKSVRYSVQEVTDCAYKVDIDSIGCRGGFPESAIDFIIKYGLDLDTDYPMVGFDHPCRMRHPRETIIRSYEYLTSDESQLMEAVTKGPLVTEIYASGDAMLSYSGGIIDDTSCPNEIDHVALIVGYDNASWILQNSWGSDWGENGYFRVKRGTHTCGVALDSIRLLTSAVSSKRENLLLIYPLVIFSTFLLPMKQ